MSIISSEIEAQKQRDPSYVDSGLQWAWGRGYKAGAWMENIIRIAFDAARRKAMEE